VRAVKELLVFEMVAFNLAVVPRGIGANERMLDSKGGCGSFKKGL